MPTVHEIVAEGSLDEVRRVLASGADPDSPAHCGQTLLMAAVASGSIDKMKLLLEQGADPELADDFNRTPLGNAVDHGFVEGAELLLGMGVDRGHNPKYPLKPVEYPEAPPTPLPTDLQGLISPEEWAETHASAQELLQELGDRPKPEPVIEDAGSVAMLRLLVDYGEDLNQAPEHVKRQFIGLFGEEEYQPSREDFRCTEHDFKRGSQRRFGLKNPSRTNNPFWDDMIRLGVDACRASSVFSSVSVSSPVWCFDRFGDTITRLLDGRFVQVGGEHEDYYDEDFCIYNDVVVHDGAGGFDVYGYPRKVFPPTDFHTATLVDRCVYLIGCLGYPEDRRPGFTPVFRLRLDDWGIECVETHGEMPGWIFRHRAAFDPDANVIRVSGGSVATSAGLPAEDQLSSGVAELDLTTLRWRRPPATGL
ncbi:MAG: ankyrin repeat domain-containing protein [Planctomycetota bacterium]